MSGIRSNATRACFASWRSLKSASVTTIKRRAWAPDDNRITWQAQRQFNGLLGRTNRQLLSSDQIYVRAFADARRSVQVHKPFSGGVNVDGRQCMTGME